MNHVHVGGVFCANLAGYSIVKYWDYKVSTEIYW